MAFTEKDFERPDGTFSQVRHNMLTEKDYTPYCGACSTMIRTIFNGSQMECLVCQVKTNFEPAFIEKYKRAQEHLNHHLTEKRA